MAQHREVTFDELFSVRFQARRGVLAPVKTSSEAESRRRNDETVDVVLSRGVRIPRLQRDYAQGRDDGGRGRVTRVRTEFLDALHKAVTGGPSISLSFVYGQFERPIEQAGVFEASLLPLDGQQRLTTLFLLHWYASRRDKRAGEAGFLGAFSYATRYSSEEFCTFLCALENLEPDESERRFLQRESLMGPDGALAGRRGSLTSFLANKAGFVESWRADPTVAGMLVMLDAVHARFSDIPDLWAELTGPRRPLRFHFLPLAAVGIEPDQIFIKMNSRGLELTEFEYFKADLLGMLEANGMAESAVTEIGTRIDRDWENSFWTLARRAKLDEGNIDPLLMRYANFVIDMLGIQSRHLERGGDHPPLNSQPHIYDPDRVRAVFEPDGVWRTKIVERFMAAFDCWTPADDEETSPIADFFQQRFVEGEQGSDVKDLKIRLFSRVGPRLLVDCVSGAKLATSDRAILFSLILSRVNDEATRATYAWDSKFSARFRAIRNITENMDSSVETLYLWLNAFPAILAGTPVDSTFGLPDVRRAIPEHVVAEENFKLALAARGDDRLRDVYRTEEHDWLRGRIDVLAPGMATSPAPEGTAEMLLDRAARLGGTLARLAAGASRSCDGDLRLALLLAVDTGTYAVRTRRKQEFWGASRGHPDAVWREVFRRPRGYEQPDNSAALLALLKEFSKTKAGVVTSDWLATFVAERRAQPCADEPEGPFGLRHYCLSYPDTMLNFPGWPHDPLTRHRTFSGIVLARSLGNRLAYLVNTAGNWFWDPFLLTILERMDPDGKLVPVRRWRGSDMTARRVVACSRYGVRCRESGFLVDATEDDDLRIEGLDEWPGEDRQIPEGHRRWLWPVRQVDGLDVEDRVLRGEELFRRLAVQAGSSA